MARGKGRGRKGLQPEGLSDFAGGDADKETIEKLAEAAKKANAKGGDNSEPKDEVIERNFNAIELAWSEIDAAGRIMQKARSALSAALKTAKTDCGSKTWATNIEKAVKLKRQGDKGGNGELVTEHRQIGRILRLKGVPLGVQFKLFPLGDEPSGDGTLAGMDANLQGQHAGRSGEPAENNPFTPGTAEFADWAEGWVNGQAMLAQGIGNGAEAATH
jgi:hypothetical protein